MQKKLVELIRSRMKQLEIDAYTIPGTDPHMSEYVPFYFRRREFVTGFTGSAGDGVITQDKAGMWTDSRYFLQAEKQLKNTPFRLMKLGEPDCPAIEQWLKTNLKPGQAAGVDPMLMSEDAWGRFSDALSERKIKLKAVRPNLVDEIWKDRPAPPDAAVNVHDNAYTGQSVDEKLQELRKSMKENNVDYTVLSMLDEIAWLFNIRGGDVEYIPVVIAYALAGMDSASIFLDMQKLTDRASEHLKKYTAVKPYGDFEKELNRIAGSNASVWIDPATASRWIVDVLDGARITKRRSRIMEMKAEKNEVEIAGIRSCHVRDGVSMVKFLYWIETGVGKKDISEISAAEKLLSFRAENDLFMGASFETITGFRQNGAIVHYAPTKETDLKLEPEGIFLVDSGGQYLDGTTDITRTMPLGNPTDEQKMRFTEVLAGNIRLSRLRFPRGTAGRQLDTVARIPLWEAGVNFGHGVGHGVGHYLSVHEGPQAISHARCPGQPLVPGMVVSIEPGYYKAGEYGIRTENLAVVVEDEETKDADQQFYRFEILTLCPIDTRLVEKSALSPADTEWFNAYHKRVYETLAPLLPESEAQWLKVACRPI